MLSAIAQSGGVVRSPLRGQDCENTLQILKDVGAIVDEASWGVRIRPSDFQSPAKPLWCGNSGTTMRLLCGLLAGVGIDAELAGDESLTRRPMRRIIEPLRAMGADIDGDTPPVRIRSSKLQGIDYLAPIASAQVKSAVLLAGLFAEGSTSVTEPVLSRDHTERMLISSGCNIHQTGLTVKVEPGRPNSIEMNVPGDISSAAFFLVAGALLGGPITIKEVGVNPTRTGILDCLRSAGVPVGEIPRKLEQGEPVADLYIDPLPDAFRAFAISGSLVPRLIDEIPILAVFATQCEGTSIVRDAKELRVKESDRIDQIATGLRAMGANVETFEDGMTITGPTPLRGANIRANGDHRIAMAFAIAGLIAEGETVIEGAEAIDTSFPGFTEELMRLCHV